MRFVFVVCTLALAAFMVSLASAQSSGGSFSITRSVVAPATSSSAGAFALTATIGQPATADSSAGAFQLQSGYAVRVSSDDIFNNGFEP